MDSAPIRERIKHAPALSYAFGDFVLDPLRRSLSRVGGARIALPARAYDALQLMVQHPGELLYKDWLVGVLWPDSVVEDNNLSQAISTLRRALGDDSRFYIQTEARRGYRFVCPVTTQSPRAPESVLERGQSAVGARSTALSTDRVPKLAVIPFINLDGDPAQEYFVAGMMEEVVAALTRIRSLFVIASSPTTALNSELPEIAARRLDVHYVLEGSVRRSHESIRIMVKLTDSLDNAQTWSERFDGASKDVFDLQDRVALAVAGVIEPSINRVETRRATRRPPESLDCYDLYLQAAHLRARLQKESVLRSLELLQRALLLDPDYAPALAQAAGCHSQILSSGWASDPDYHRRQGHELAARALRDGGDDPGVLAQVANALMDLEQEPGSNIDQAITLISRATDLNPGSAFAWFISGVLCMIDGDGDMAVEHLQRAIRLDPVSSLQGIARAHLGLALAVQGRYAESVRILRASSNLTARAQLVLACASCELGQIVQARSELMRYEQMTHVPAEALGARMTRNPSLRAFFIDALSRIRSAS
jgi:TolB-like protein/Flp pilus assembly protein TadD